MRNAVCLCVAVLGISLSGIMLSGQSATTGPRFEVASVRENRSGSRTSTIRPIEGGRFEAANVPLVQLIEFGYALTVFQRVEGGPSWINDARFDVRALTGQDPGPIRQGVAGPLQRMIQQLLAERFQLQVHLQERAADGYALTLSRSDRATGPNLKPSPYDCTELRAKGEPLPVRPEGFGYCTIQGRDGRVRAGGHSMAEFGTFLGRALKLPVIDETGLAGPFDIDITYAPPQLPPGATTSLPSLDTALREDLGLRLTRRQQNVTDVVIDRVERPTLD